MAGSYYSKKQNSYDEKARLDELKAAIKQGSISKPFLFYGQEEYMKRFYFGELCKSSGDNANITVIDEDDFSAQAFLDAVNTVPSIDYSDSFFDDEPTKATTIRLVKVVCPNVSKLSQREATAIFEACDYLPSGVCIVFYFHYAEEGRRSKEYEKNIKALCDGSKAITAINFLPELPTSPLLKKWIKRHFDAKKCSIDAAGIEYLISSVGTDMTTLSFEIEKLCAYLCDREIRVVYNDDIDLVCIKNVEARIEDVSKGIIEGSYQRAACTMNVLCAEKVPETYIFGAISNKISELYTVAYFQSKGMAAMDIAKTTGIREFVVKNDLRLLDSKVCSQKRLEAIIKILSEYDIKLKSSAVNKYLLLYNMIIKCTTREKNKS